MQTTATTTMGLRPATLVAVALAVLLVQAAVCGAATTYYISPTGNDTHAGTSPGTAWQTLTRVGLLGLGDGDALLLARNGSWLGEQLAVPAAVGATIGAYGDTTLPRPHITLPRGLTRLVACVEVRGANRVTIQDLHLSGGGRGVHVVTTAAASNISIINTVFADIKTPDTAYSPANPNWAVAVWVDAAAGVADVRVANCIGLRVNSFFGHAGFITDLTLDALTLSKCGGNCISLIQATNMTLSNTVFLRDTPERLFLYGTTDVIVGTVYGTNQVIDTDFNARGEYMGGPDGCALDFETSATDFTISGCTFSRSYGSGIMVFGHATTSHDLLITGNTFAYDGCIQPATDHGGIAFICPGGNRPSGTVADNHFLACPGGPPPLFNRIAGCDANMTIKDNVFSGFQVTEQPVLNLEPPSSTSTALSGTFPIIGTSRTPNATIRYTLDGSRPSESSPVVPKGGVVVSWPGPVVAVNMRAFAPGMLPSVTNGMVLEDDYVMARLAHLPPQRGMGGSFDTLSISAGTVHVSGWAVDGALPGDGFPAVTVRVTVDRILVAAVVAATVPRPDVVAAGDAPNPDHGFSLDLSTAAAAAVLQPGKHVIEVFAFGTPGSLVPWELPLSPRCVCGGIVCAC